MVNWHLYVGVALLLGACSGVAPLTSDSGASAEQSQRSLAVSGHLICSAIHTFFKPDTAGRESLVKAAHPLAAEQGYMMVQEPDPEPYFAFRSTYLPPVRSFMRVEVADTQFEVSAGWDEVCPVRAVMNISSDGSVTYTDYAPADADFLKQLAEEYNREAVTGIYKGMAGTPTTEAMRGRALPADFYGHDKEATGPHSKRFKAEGEVAYEKACEEAHAVDVREHNYLRDVFDFNETPDCCGGHTEEWATIEPNGNVVSIHNTPYRLRYERKNNDEEWQLFFEDTSCGSKLPIPVHVGTHKLPFFVAHSSHCFPQDAATVLYLAPDSASMVIDAFYYADHEESGPICVSWRRGNPVLGDIIRTRSCLERTATETNEVFVGWKNNVPVSTVITEFGAWGNHHSY